MAAPNISLNNNKMGTCPHGMPLGACPICSGMGGGGSKTNNAKKGEMSWNDCYAIGQLMKAQAQRTDNQKNSELQASQMTIMLSKIANSLAQKLMPMVNFVQSNMIIPVKNFANNVKQMVSKFAKPVMNMFSNLSNNIKNSLKGMMEKFTNISDKLAAIFGSEETDKREKLSDIFKRLRIKDFNPFEDVNESNNDGNGGDGGFYFQQENEDEDEKEQDNNA